MKQLISTILFSPPLVKRLGPLLARIHQTSYLYLGRCAAAWQGGLHPKHRLTRYHDFFIENISEGDRVLEVGCRNGTLLRDIAVKCKKVILGVESNPKNVAAARSRFKDLPKVEIIHSDI